MDGAHAAKPHVSSTPMAAGTRTRPGGWGAILISGKHRKRSAGRASDNQQPHGAGRRHRPPRP